MNRERIVWPAGLLFLVACFLFAAFAVKIRFSVPAPAIDADRAAVRGKALAEIRAIEFEALHQAGWIDQSRGLVRLPIDVAMQITGREWQNPAVARSNLILRAEKAAPPAGPAPAPAPAQPSAFE
jgi:hypothetical protein